MPDAVPQLQEAERRIRAAAEEDAPALDLSNLGLTDIPAAVFTLRSLRHLDLSVNPLGRLPEAIGELGLLEELDLGGNGLTSLPDAIGQLSRLRQLDVSLNQLVALPDAIGRLAQLESLAAWRNRLTVLPPAVGRLTALRSLDISENPLGPLPASIGQLPRLWFLFARHIGLAALPDTIGDLTQLRALLVRGNLLTSLPESLGQLAQLKHLDASNNQLTALPEALGQLAQLEQLDVSRNQLAALPEALGQLAQLQRLDVSRNQLTTLPDAIAALPALRDLDLAQNALTTLPDTLRDAPLDSLMLQGNPALDIPDSVLGKYRPWYERHGVEDETRARTRTKAILAHYFSSRDLDGKPLAEVKLLVVGRGESGKTTLIRRLRGMRFGKPPKETQGIDITPWTLDCNGLDVRVNVWDFAGQVITHATHQFFLTERSVYLLVLTGRGDLQRSDADYWLRLIQAFGTGSDGRTSPVVIALNKWAPPGFKLDRNGLKEKYPFIAGFVETECKGGHGLEPLQSLLRDTIGGMSEVRQPIPLAWWRIKHDIERRQKRSNHMAYGAFETICRKAGVPTDAPPVLARLFHALGIALNYGDDERLRDNTVLNPSWVTASIYALLRDGANAETAELRQADLERVLPKESPEMRRYLVDLMRRFDLAFPLNDEADRWLVPQRLPEEQPELGEDWQAGDATRLRFSYSVVPEGLLPRFITRTYPLSQGPEAGTWLPRWANGVVLADREAHALVKADLEDRRVNVTVLGPADARQGLLGLIESEFARIHGEITGLDPKAELWVAADGGADWMSLDTLRADEARRRQSYLNTRQGSVEVAPTTELNRISALAARDPWSWKARVFVSYCSKDGRFKDELLMRLRQLQRAEGLIELWHDGLIAPGDEWDDTIRDELANSDIVLLLVSNHFLDSAYIRGVEVQRAVERANRGEARLVPIVLEQCQWTHEPFGRFNALPRKGEPIRDSKPQRNAWEAVRAELGQLVKALRDSGSGHRASRDLLFGRGAPLLEEGPHGP
ncbi:COR domain-containing protein [Zoogloea sp.]|uniref:leucine-rich repeat domain-containing protein n=1 Tax=Zoogloea sp. TaxID=49181 RepID=UPI0035B278A3